MKTGGGPFIIISAILLLTILRGAWGQERRCFQCNGTGHIDTPGHLPGGGTIKCPVCKEKKP